MSSCVAAAAAAGAYELLVIMLVAERAVCREQLRVLPPRGIELDAQPLALQPAHRS